MRWLGIEDGVTAVILALIIIPLMGIAALVVDVGLMRWEVRQLQNGADAAALAIAQDCADGNNCRANADGIADRLTDRNANDGVAAAQVAFDTAGPNTVTVTATTLDGTGSSRLGYIFAPALGFTDGTFARSATAVWGPIALLDASLPLTISECEWDLATQEGTQLPSDPTVILIKGNPNANECTIPGSPGFYQPGGFGWLDTTGTGCEALISLEDVPGNTGNTPPQPACGHNVYDWPALLGTTVLIPIHHTATGPGNNLRFDMLGFAAFTITSYKVGGAQYEGGPETCPGTGNNQRCLIGRFEEFVPIDGDVDLDLPDLGARTVQLIG